MEQLEETWIVFIGKDGRSHAYQRYKMQDIQLEITGIATDPCLDVAFVANVDAPTRGQAIGTLRKMMRSLPAIEAKEE